MKKIQPMFMTCIAKGQACYLRSHMGYIQWRSGEKGEWYNLVELSALIVDPMDAEAATVAELLCSLHGRLSAIEEKLKGNMGNITVDKIVIHQGVTQYGADGNTVLRETGAPNTIPEFEGQEYINLDTGDHYKSNGNTAVLNWQKINN